ncbi:MAG: hypothetical protein WBF09_07395, partial [Candidatus Acidiferrum sp.]
MQWKQFLPLIVVLMAVGICGCRSKKGTSEKAGESQTPADVDESRMLHADDEPGNWMSNGRTYSEQRFSPLKQINDQNVGQLGLAW